jgi:uncharacterized membrane protein YraQ (UPF0718 family)
MHDERKRSGIGGWLFLLMVLGCYGLVGAIDADLLVPALELFGGVIAQVLPVLGVVFLLLLAADFALSPHWVRRNLGQHSGLRGWLMAALGGVLATGPVYPWYALLGDLRDKGMRTSLVAVFLYSRAVKLPLIPLLVHYFGIRYALLLCALLLLFAQLNGLLIGRLLRDRSGG